MQRITILLFLSLFCFATAVQAQAPAPKPGPEAKKLNVYLGHWTYEGESKPGPLGPGGKSTGETNCQMILGGFFLECRGTEKGPAGETHGLEIMGYDPVNKNFSDEFYADDGSRFSGAATVSGDTWTEAGRFVSGGKEYQARGTSTLAADLMSITSKSEISVDGKTWTAWEENKTTKTKPAPKK
jgi:hypothetical protein